MQNNQVEFNRCFRGKYLLHLILFPAYVLLTICPTNLSSLNMEAAKFLRTVSKLLNYTMSRLQNHRSKDSKTENRVLRGTLGRIGRGMTGGCVKLDTDGLHNLHASSNIIRVTESMGGETGDIGSPTTYVVFRLCVVSHPRRSNIPTVLTISGVRLVLHKSLKTLNRSLSRCARIQREERALSTHIE